MQPGISIVWDVFEMQDKIFPVLRAIASEIQELPCMVEIIIVDRGSGDNTVFEALQAAETYHLQAKVIQSGAGNDGSALNAGIFRAGGKYITFLRPDAFFRGHLKPLYEAIEKKEADLAFGEMLSTEFGAGKPTILQRIRHAYFRDGNGADTLLALIKGEKAADFSCLLFKSEFIFYNKLLFEENARIGCEEEFLDRCLLLTDHVCEVRGPFVRDKNLTFQTEKEIPPFAGFDRVDAIVRIYEDAKIYRKDSKNLIEVLKDHKIPQIVLETIESSLQSGCGYNVLRHYMSKNGYQKLLHIGRLTPFSLRRKILLWRNLPWMY